MLGKPVFFSYNNTGSIQMTRNLRHREDEFEATSEVISNIEASVALVFAFPSVYNIFRGRLKKCISFWWSKSVRIHQNI